MDSFLSKIDETRQSFSNSTDETHKAKLGQYFTPSSIAVFMASLFDLDKSSNYKILDPGAGIGSLSSALLTRSIDHNTTIKHTVTAIEYDANLVESLKEHLNKFTNSHLIVNDNFIDWAKSQLNAHDSYDLAILNPPYKKLSSISNDKKTLKELGIDVVNYYAAFVALSLKLLTNNGQLVAIIPRSFCNGVYFKPFRKYILSMSSINSIHIFDSRSEIFIDEEILQENVILHLTKGTVQGNVKISTSTDSLFKDIESIEYPFEKIVNKDDIDHFIHIPTKKFNNLLVNKNRLTQLSELDIQVSTGPVVDFRVKDSLAFAKPLIEESSPLLYPSHFDFIQDLNWPNIKDSKANFLTLNDKTKKMVYKNGYYTIVRRFSPKEQKHRIIAHFVDAKKFEEYEYFAFENHLNVFHSKKKGLKKEIALGLTTFLNSSAIDHHFRQFSGHTQINVGDLKKLPFPTSEILEEIGNWVLEQEDLTQQAIDQKIKGIFS